MLSYNYNVFGLHVASALELPALSGTRSNGFAAESGVEVRLGTVPLLQNEDQFDNGCHHASPEQVILYYPEVGRILVRRGQEIVVDPQSEIDDSSLQLYILGIAFAILLHQREFLVLHASGVIIDGGAVLFLGEAGWGKSTMAAALHDRGHRFITDDVAAVTFSDAHHPMVHPGIPQFRLWPEAAASLGKHPDRLPKLKEGVEKRLQTIDQPFAPESYPVRRLFVLKPGHELNVTPLNPTRAFGNVLRHSCVRSLMHDMNTTTRHLNQCVTLLRHTAARHFERPDDLRQLDRMAAFVENNVLHNGV